MIRENHYSSLRKHIYMLLEGLTNHKEDLPSTIESYISEAYYQEALDKLEKRKRKLEKREEDYRKAVEKFHQEYELVRRVWKNDVMKLKRSFNKEKDKLSDFGINQH